MRPWRIVQGEVRQTLKTFAAAWADGAFCDPPYGIRMHGASDARWDYDVPSANVWAELLRVLKPGAYAMIYGGPRTFHRMAVAVEDAGFRIVDTCMFLHASGMPKSLDLAKAIDKKAGVWRGRAGKKLDQSPAFHGPHYERTEKGEPATELGARWQGYGTQLAPAYEPLIVAQKPFRETYVDNLTEHGVGGLAIDASRVGDEERFNPGASATGMWATLDQGESGRPPVGRWPKNVLLDEEVGAMLDAQVGDRPGMSGGGKHRADYAGGMFGAIDAPHLARGDHGGPSRFFFTAKASRRERDAGCDSLPVGPKGVGALRDGGRSEGTVRNTHTCVKPLSLNEYFARLILPPSRPGGEPRRVLCPYSGSGSEMMGCLLAGWDEVVGIEREEKYVRIAEARISKGRIFERRHQSKR